MATDIATALDEMLALAAAPSRQSRVLELRAAYEARTGSFGTWSAASPRWQRESFFEARSAAFWDDALTRHAFGRELREELSEGGRAFVEPLARAHRGLFFVRPGDGAFLLVDEWSGAEFSAEPSSEGLRDALERSAGLLDGRVIGAGRIVLLPGAVFHHADALEPIRALLPEARARGMETHDLLDALLRMDLSLRTLSRVKAAFAYRKEALK